MAPGSPIRMSILQRRIELKIQALLSHRSQLTEPEEMAQYVRQFASQRGEQIGCRYAEAFRRMDVPQ